MNPIEEFYKKKNTYKNVKRMSENFYDIYEVNLAGNLNDGWNIVISLRGDLFEDIKNDEKWEIYKPINEYIQAQRDKIKLYIIKKLKEKMEEIKVKVLKDFDLKEVKKIENES